jgi:hypothetical protein
MQGNISTELNQQVVMVLLACDSSRFRPMCILKENDFTISLDNYKFPQIYIFYDKITYIFQEELRISMTLNISHIIFLPRITRLEFHDLQMDFAMPFCTNES